MKNKWGRNKTKNTNTCKISRFHHGKPNHFGCERIRFGHCEYIVVHNFYCPYSIRRNTSTNSSGGYYG